MTLPVLLSYNLIGGLNINLGPEIGYLISAKSKANNYGKRDLIEFWKFNNYDYNRLDLGLCGELSWNLSSDLTCGVRYVYGVSGVINVDPFTNSDGTISDGYKLQNRTLQLSIKYFM